MLTVPFGLASAAGLQGPSSTEGPKVSMASTKRDFGDVYAGEELEQYFPVRNLGGKQLELAQKSSLGSRSGAPAYKAVAAVLRPREHFLVRSVGARPAAPS